ncbi:hypothetical protein BAE44_0016258 [Dichanthelium oligosanthes]|uniref:Uncharacterized protein n=1 Tax=Dichanthelium oligosanthes TaxID=888268 RepID=A0A1E5VCF4_9POAL|nr:hypothetical protein BAE44_0016258 [Dichanthelium oligosanthes]
MFQLLTQWEIPIWKRNQSSTHKSNVQKHYLHALRKCLRGITKFQNPLPDIGRMALLRSSDVTIRVI